MKRYYKLPIWERNEATYRAFRGDLSLIRNYGHKIELVPLMQYDEDFLLFALKIQGQYVHVPRQYEEMKDITLLTISVTSSFTLSAAHALWQTNRAKIFKTLFTTIEALWADAPKVPISNDDYIRMCDYLFDLRHNKVIPNIGWLQFINPNQCTFPGYLGEKVPVTWSMKT